MKHILVIPHIVPTANKFKDLHWGDKVNLKQKWLQWLIVRGELVTKSKGKRKITVTRISRGRPDTINLVFPTDKLIIDPMRSKIKKRLNKKKYVTVPGLGWIIDDSDEWLELVCKREAGADETKIEIEDI